MAQQHPAVAYVGGGRYAVIWDESETYDPPGGIFAAGVTTDGQLVGGQPSQLGVAIDLAACGTCRLANPNIAVGDDVFFLSWLNNDELSGLAKDIDAAVIFPLVQPENDAFANGLPLATQVSPIVGRNVAATKEPGEPSHGLDAGGASVWYSWAPQFTGTAYVSTEGSEFDTTLGVYNGSTVSALSGVALNDDGLRSSSTSMACFPASAGATYRIAVDGFAADLGYDDSLGGLALEWGPEDK